MGATLQDTLAEADQLISGQQNAPAAPPPTAPKAVTAAPASGGDRVSSQTLSDLVTGTPAKPKKGLIGQAVDAVKATAASAMGAVQKDGLVTAGEKTAESIGAGIIRAPGQLIGGAVDTGADIGRFVGNSIAPQFVRATGQLLQAAGTAGGSAPLRDLGKRVATGASIADAYSMRPTLGQAGYPALNQLATEGSATALGIAAAPGKGLVQGALKAAGASAVGMSADNLGDRTKNAALGAGLEVGATAIGAGFKAARGALKQPTRIVTGTPAEAAQDALDRDFATRRTQQAQADAAQAQADQAKAMAPTQDAADGTPQAPPPPPEVIPQEQLDAGTRHSDPQPVSQEETPSANDSATAQPPHPLASDTNHALEVSGAAERLPTDGSEPPLSPNGKVIVTPESKAAVDDAGLGRGFIASDDGLAGKDSTIFKEEAPDGSSRVVGSMPNEDLANFASDVQHFRDNPDEVNIPEGQPHGQWSMAHIGSDVDTAPVLRALVKDLPEPAELPSKEAVAQGARDFADQSGMSVEDAANLAHDIVGENGDNLTALKAVQLMWKRAGDNVSQWAGKDIDWANAPQDVVDRARLDIDQAHRFSSYFENVKSFAGRALNEVGSPDADTYLAAARRADKDPLSVAPVTSDNPFPRPRTREEMGPWLDMWNAIKDDPASQANFLKELRQYPSGSMYLRTAFANAFTGMVLSGVKTIAMNILGPAVLGTLRTLERTAGGAMMGLNPLVDAATREAGMAAALQAPVTYVQALGDTATAFKYAVAAFKAQESILAPHTGSPIDASNMLNIPVPLIASAVADGKSALPYYMGNVLNLFPTQVWRMHLSVNEMALHMSYMGEVRARAMLEGTTDLKLSGPDLQAFVAKRLDEATDNATGQATDAVSLDSAHRSTLVRAADPDFAPGRASFDRTIQSWRVNFPELRYILPIFNVPANGLAETLRRIPGAGFMLNETRAELSGDLGTYRQAEAYGRMMLGGAFLTSATLMARAGTMTGAGPADPKDRAVWLERNQPYSLRLGGTQMVGQDGKPYMDGGRWVAYDRLDPIGPLLAIGAGFTDRSVYHPTDQNLTMAAIGSLAEYLKDKSSIQGVSDLLNFGGDPSSQGALEHRVGSTVGGFFVPSFLKPVRAAFDEDLRVKRTPLDYIIDAMPGVSTRLDPVRNLLGENVMKPAQSIAENLLPVTTARISTAVADPVMDEIDRLYTKTGYVPGMPTASAGPGSHVDLRDVKLSDGHSIYDHWMRNRQTATLDGQTLRQALASAINSPEYAEAQDGTGKVQGDDEFAPKEDTRGGILQKVFTDYSKEAKAVTAREDPVAARWFAAGAAKSALNDRLRPYATKDIATNPDLTKALGIDLTHFEDKIKGADQ